MSPQITCCLHPPHRMVPGVSSGSDPQKSSCLICGEHLPRLEDFSIQRSCEECMTLSLPDHFPVRVFLPHWLNLNLVTAFVATLFFPVTLEANTFVFPLWSSAAF